MIYKFIYITLKIISLISLNADLLKQHLPSFLKIIIPLSLTLYLFAYKERKDITYSYLRSKKMAGVFIGFIICTISIIIFLYFNYIYRFNSIFSDIVLIVIFISWFNFLFRGYLEIFNTVNIFYVFEKHTKLMNSTSLSIEKFLNRQLKVSKISIYFSKNILFGEKVSNIIWYYSERYIRVILFSKLKSFDIFVQINSQILLSKIKYNLPKDFSINLDKFLNELRLFISITTKANLEHIASLNLIEQYCEVYSSILRNIELLTEYSSKNGKSRDMEALISFFERSTVGPYEFTEVLNFYISANRINSDSLLDTLKSTNYSYIQSLRTLTFILSNSKYWDEIKLLRNFKGLSNEDESITDGSFTTNQVLTLYTAFLIEATNKNDIKLLTDTVNLIMENRLTVNEYINNIFILCSTKAIELGHYKCAGHLIKMTLLQSNDLLLKSSLKDIYENLNSIDSFNGQEFVQFCTGLDHNLINSFRLSMPFSSISFEYCFSKLVYMLSLQQKYKIKNPTPPLVFESFGFSTSKQYIVDKIIDLHKEYGLVILRNDIMKMNEETLKFAKT